jgi:hypothetical protein
VRSTIFLLSSFASVDSWGGPSLSESHEDVGAVDRDACGTSRESASLVVGLIVGFVLLRCRPVEAAKLVSVVCVPRLTPPWRSMLLVERRMLVVTERSSEFTSFSGNRKTKANKGQSSILRYRSWREGPERVYHYTSSTDISKSTSSALPTIHKYYLHEVLRAYKLLVFSTPGRGGRWYWCTRSSAYARMHASEVARTSLSIERCGWLIRIQEWHRFNLYFTMSLIPDI